MSSARGFVAKRSGRRHQQADGRVVRPTRRCSEWEIPSPGEENRLRPSSGWGTCLGDLEGVRLGKATASQTAVNFERSRSQPGQGSAHGAQPYRVLAAQSRASGKWHSNPGRSGPREDRPFDGVSSIRTTPQVAWSGKKRLSESEFRVFGRDSSPRIRAKNLRQPARQPVHRFGAEPDGLQNWRP